MLVPSKKSSLGAGEYRKNIIRAGVLRHSAAEVGGPTEVSAWRVDISVPSSVLDTNSMAGVLYILQSENNGRYYVGSTSDLARRLDEHRRGHTYTTRRLRPFNIVFSQEFATLKEARTAERKIKSWKRRDFIETIVRNQVFRLQ